MFEILLIFIMASVTITVQMQSKTKLKVSETTMKVFMSSNTALPLTLQIVKAK
jgi:hypothetical protein